MRKQFLFIIVLTLLLFSCTTVVYMDLLHIQKGQTIDEVVSIITDDNYDEGISLINDDHKMDLFRFQELDSEILITYKYYEPYTGNDYSYYIFAFINDELTFWGLPYEFANHSNSDINDLGIEASNIITLKYMED